MNQAKLTVFTPALDDSKFDPFSRDFGTGRARAYLVDKVGPTGRLRACLRRPTLVNCRRRRGARYIIAAAPMFCSRVQKLCGRKRDSVANSGVIAFSAGIVSRPVREAPSHFHACLRGLGLLPGSSPSLDKILGGKCLFGPIGSRVFGV